MHNQKRLLLAVLCTAAAIAAGALFLIAPVWQPGYHTIGFAAQAQVDAAQAQVDAAQAAINLNTATEQELNALPGIGESRAAAIVQYRQQHGGFTDISQLAEIPGISQAMLAGWDGMLYISAQTNETASS